MALPYQMNDPVAVPTSATMQGTAPQEDVFDDIVTTAEAGKGGIIVPITNAVANHYNESTVSKSFITGATQGKDFPTQIRDMKKWKEETRIAEANQAELMRQRSTLQVAPTNTVGHDTAIKNYREGIGQAPATPEMVSPQASDLEKIIGAIAIATGTPVKSVLEGLGGLAGARANQQNKQSMQQHDILDKAYQKKMFGLKFDMETEGDNVQRQDTQNMRNFTANDRALGGQIDDYSHVIRTREALISKGEAAIASNLKTLERSAQQYVRDGMTGGGVFTETMQKGLWGRAEQIALIHHGEDATTEEILQYTQDVYDQLSLYALGQESLAKQKADNTQSNAKRRLDATELKQYHESFQKYVDGAMKSRTGLTKEHIAEIKRFIATLPEDDQDDFIIPSPGELHNSWLGRQRLAETERHNKKSEGIAQDNLNERVLHNTFDEDFKTNESLTKPQKDELKRVQENLNKANAEVTKAENNLQMGVAKKEEGTVIAELTRLVGQAKAEQNKASKEWSKLEKDYGFSGTKAGSRRSASVRNNNPGAMWDNPIAKEFGSKGAQKLNDGLGQNNQIATFDDPVSGAAAQFALLDRKYAGKSLASVIGRWSGGNNVNEYLALIKSRTGISPNTVISKEFLRTSKGLELVKTMARHEAGSEYPLTNDQWVSAQAMGTGAKPSAQPKTATKTPAKSTPSKTAPKGKVTTSGKTADGFKIRKG